MATNTEKPPRRPGRPSKAAELERALAALAFDWRTVDPLPILAGIMMNAALPAAARVQAARLLIEARARGAAETKGKDKPGTNKAAAARAAAAAGGPASQWGSDLWPDGRRPT